MLKKTPEAAYTTKVNYCDSWTSRGTTRGLVTSVYVYDPQADAWTQLANMSTAQFSHASTAVSGKLYVFGGYGLDTAAVYDPASDCWVEVSILTSKRHNFVAVAL